MPRTRAIKDKHFDDLEQPLLPLSFLTFGHHPITRVSAVLYNPAN